MVARFREFTPASSTANVGPTKCLILCTWWKWIPASTASFSNGLCKTLKETLYALYFIKYNAPMSIVRTWISQWFLAKQLFLFFKNNFTRINHCKFIYHKSHLKPFLSYLPCIVYKEYFSILFNVKKCALYSIKYSMYHVFHHHCKIIFFKKTVEFWVVSCTFVNKELITRPNQHFTTIALIGERDN